MSLNTRLQQRYAIQGDVLAHDALTCIRALVAALTALLADPTDKRAIKNATALLTKLGRVS